MPKINVYLPDELAAAVKTAHLPVSAICQTALERAVREVTALREGTPGSGRPVENAGVLADDWAGLTNLAFARYTNRANQALMLARRAAVRLGHADVGTEHLLLGILDEGGNLALRVLDGLDVSPEDVRAELGAYLVNTGSEVTATPLSPPARQALELTLAEATKLGHNYIGCEHLLLGLIAEPDGLAGSVLRQLGMELHITRRAVVTALVGFAHAAHAEPAVPRSRLDEILHRLEAIEARLAG